MTQEHPITPPPELVQQWREAPEFSALSPCVMVTVTTTKLQDIATQAARWGADQELEACCEWLDEYLLAPKAAQLRLARRPKPKSQAEQALEALGPEPLPEMGGTDDCFLNAGAINRYRTIRAALERLRELEGGR